MNGMVICLLVLASVLFGQSAPSERDAVIRLSTNLLLLTDSVAGMETNRKLADQMLSIADPYHKPTYESLLGLARELSSAFGGRQLAKSEIVNLSGAIVAVLYSAGVGTVELRDSLGRAEKALLLLGVDKSKIRKVITGLTAIGREVRGPEDLPLVGQ